MSIVKKYRAEVADVKNPIKDIYVVSLKSPDKQFKYKPGQFLHLTLDEYDPSMQWPESRCFSMQSSPREGDITITFSVAGKYTRRMATELTTGKNIWLKLPYGELFSRSYSKEKCVFVAGGTGITPYLSLFCDDSFSEYDNPKLYFGLKSKDFNLYNKSLDKAVKVNERLNINLVYENVDGILNKNKIYEENGNDSTYFVSGPPAMIKNFKEFFMENGVAENRIVTDDWE